MPNNKKPKVKKAEKGGGLSAEKGSGLSAENSPQAAPTQRMTRALSAGAVTMPSSELSNVSGLNIAEFQSAKGSQSQPLTSASASDPSAAGTPPNAMETTTPVIHGMDPAQLPLAQTVTAPVAQAGPSTSDNGNGSANNTPKSKAKKKKDEHDVSFNIENKKCDEY